MADADRRLEIELSFEDLAGTTDRDFFLPGFLNDLLADCAVDEPAQVTGIELPCRTGLSHFFGTLADVPAVDERTVVFFGQEKQQLPLDMAGNIAPALFVAANRFQRYPKQCGKLFLGLGQSFSDGSELVFIHSDRCVIKI